MNQNIPVRSNPVEKDPHYQNYPGQSLNSPDQRQTVKITISLSTLQGPLTLTNIMELYNTKPSHYSQTMTTAKDAAQFHALEHPVLRNWFSCSE